MVGKFGGPHEGVLAGHRVHRANDQLEDDQSDAVGGHGDSPVLQAIVDHEQLHFQRVVGHDQSEQDHGGDCDQRLHRVRVDGALWGGRRSVRVQHRAASGKRVLWNPSCIL